MININLLLAFQLLHQALLIPLQALNLHQIVFTQFLQLLHRPIPFEAPLHLFLERGILLDHPLKLFKVPLTDQRRLVRQLAIDVQLVLEDQKELLLLLGRRGRAAQLVATDLLGLVQGSL